MYQATVSFPIPRKKAFLGGSFPGSLATQKNDSLFQFFMFTYSSIILLIIKNNIENIFVFTLYKTFNINNFIFDVQGAILFRIFCLFFSRLLTVFIICNALTRLLINGQLTRFPWKRARLAYGVCRLLAKAHKNSNIFDQFDFPNFTNP